MPVPAHGDPLTPPVLRRSGYWMLTAAGAVHAFGDAPDLGGTAADAADLKPAPTGGGYWILGRTGDVSAHGTAPALSITAISICAAYTAAADLLISSGRVR